MANRPQKSLLLNLLVNYRLMPKTYIQEEYVMLHLDGNCEKCVEKIPKKVIEDFLQWSKIHIIGIKMRHDAMGSEYDTGYIRAGKAMIAELTRLLEEYEDDRFEGSNGILE